MFRLRALEAFAARVILRPSLARPSDQPDPRKKDRRLNVAGGGRQAFAPTQKAKWKKNGEMISTIIAP